jgi:hypothetical protein
MPQPCLDSCLNRLKEPRQPPLLRCLDIHTHREGYSCPGKRALLVGILLRNFVIAHAASGTLGRNPCARVINIPLCAIRTASGCG